MHPQVLSSNIQIKYLPELLSMAKEFESLNDKNTKESAMALRALDNFMKGSGLIPKPRNRRFFQNNPKRMSHFRAYWLITAHLNRCTDVIEKSEELKKDLETILRVA